MPLRLRAERQYPVPPLALPDISYLPPTEELSQYGAIALFAEVEDMVTDDRTITGTCSYAEIVRYDSVNTGGQRGRTCTINAVMSCRSEVTAT